MNVQYKKGDLLEATEDIIAHGCNCVGIMGAGVARVISDRWPVVFPAYSKACNAGLFQLGTCQLLQVSIPFPVPTRGMRIAYVANLGTQHAPGPDFRLSALRTALDNLVLRVGRERVAIPKIGAGLGGGNWHEIERVLFDTPLNFTVYVLE
jgi:O-acetyl-ADP-ribose deacetylase (regulator of RNase III)